LVALRSLVVVAVLVLPGCRGGGPRARAEAASLHRQTEGLRALLATAEGSRFFSPDQLAIGVKAELIRDVLQRRLPVETVVAGGLRVRIERAQVSLESSQSLITLQGRVSADQADGAYADLELLGGLRRFEVDAGSGVLTAHVDLDRVEVQRLAAGILERGLVQGATESLGGRGLGALGEVVPRLEIPMRLDRAVDFPGFAEGVVSVAPKRLPLRVSVARVVPLAGRLWIFLDVSAGPPLAGQGRRP
jgi:hypothetical protein